MWWFSGGSVQYRKTVMVCFIHLDATEQDITEESETMGQTKPTGELKPGDKTWFDDHGLAGSPNTMRSYYHVLVIFELIHFYIIYIWN